MQVARKCCFGVVFVATIKMHVTGNWNQPAIWTCLFSSPPFCCCWRCLGHFVVWILLCKDFYHSRFAKGVLPFRHVARASLFLELVNESYLADTFKKTVRSFKIYSKRCGWLGSYGWLGIFIVRRWLKVGKYCGLRSGFAKIERGESRFVSGRSCTTIARFLLNEHGGLYFLSHNNTVHITLFN